MGYYKIIGFAVVGLVAMIMLKRMKDEYAVILSLFLTVVLTVCAIGIIRPVIEYLKTFTENNSVYNYTTLIFKSCGIALITSVATDICKDSGEISLASKIELCGKCLIVSLSLPLIKKVYEISASILG